MMETNLSFNAEVLVREINSSIQGCVEMAFDCWKAQRYITHLEVLNNADGMMFMGKKLCKFYGIDPEQILIPSQILMKLSEGKYVKYPEDGKEVNHD